MADEKYNLVFKGQLAKGVALADAKKNIAQLFKVSAAKVDALFSGQAVVLKRDLNADAANKYRVAIKKAGALVDLVQVRESKAPLGKANFGVPEEPPVAPAKKASAAPGAIPGTIPGTKPKPEVTPEPESEYLTLAPVGADLLVGSERKVTPRREVDTSGLSLRENTGNLLDARETETPPLAEPEVVDFGLAEPGALVLREEERPKVAAVEVDISGLELGELGGNLAPAKPAPPAAPDVSGLSLER